jgi:hypothetical protein
MEMNTTIDERETQDLGQNQDAPGLPTLNSLYSMADLENSYGVYDMQRVFSEIGEVMLLIRVPGRG